VFIGASAGEDLLAIYGFDQCDGRPCIAGITPGVTRLDSFDVIQEQVGQTVSRGIGEIDIQIGDVLGSTVTSVYVNGRTWQPTELPPLGYFIARYGTPCGIQRYSAEPVTLVNFPAMIVYVVRSPDRQIGPHDPVESVYLTDGHAPNPCAFAREAWFGFRSSQP
jgi:hypothetical protein